MQMRISLFEPRRDIALYLKIHSLQELLNRARLLPVSLTPLAPLGLSPPGHPVVEYLDVYELEVAYPVVHDALPQAALVHLHHIDYVPFLEAQCCNHEIIRETLSPRPVVKSRDRRYQDPLNDLE